jgi:uncharacterized protein YjbI with pentapeptide repeats
MRALRNQSLNRLIDRDSAADITDLRIVDSNFTGCVLSYSTDPRLRTTVSNVTLEGCSADDCRIYGAQFTDVSVENLHTSENGLSVTGAVSSTLHSRGAWVLFKSIVESGSLA